MRPSPTIPALAPPPRSASVDRVGLLAGAGSLAVHGALGAVLVFAEDVSPLRQPEPPIVYQVVYMAPPAPLPAELFAAALADAIEIADEPAPPDLSQTPASSPPAEIASDQPDLADRMEVAALTPPDEDAVRESKPAPLALRPRRKPDPPPVPAPRPERDSEPVPAPAPPPSADPIETSVSAVIAKATGQRCRVTIPRFALAPPRALGYQPIPAEIIEDTLTRYAGAGAIAPNGWLQWWEGNRERFARAEFGELMAEVNARAGAARGDDWRAFEFSTLDTETITQLMQRYQNGAAAGEGFGPESQRAWWREMARHEYRRWQAWAHQDRRAQLLNRMVALNHRGGAYSSLAGVDCADGAYAGGPG